MPSIAKEITISAVIPHPTIDGLVALEKGELPSTVFEPSQDNTHEATARRLASACFGDRPLPHRVDTRLVDTETISEIRYQMTPLPDAILAGRLDWGEAPDRNKPTTTPSERMQIQLSRVAFDQFQYFSPAELVNAVGNRSNGSIIDGILDICDDQIHAAESLGDETTAKAYEAVEQAIYMNQLKENE